MEDRIFEIVNLNDFDSCSLLDADEMYDFFCDALGEADADHILDWAVQSSPGDVFDMYPAAPYMISCRER